MNAITVDGVVATNDDASICKYQAVSKGYYRDPYIDCFISNKFKNSSNRKAPEICRGYYARSVSIACIVEQFILAHKDGQVVSLGSGYDSLFWRLRSHNMLRGLYIEIDLNLVTISKIISIRKHKKLTDFLTNMSLKGENLHSDQYHLISFDLRQVNKASLEQTLAKDCKIDFNRPTLFFTECVLVYMSIQDSSSLIQWIGTKFTDASMLNYEQCNMTDRFGDIMLANMNARNCDLMGVTACQSIDSQTRRLKDNNLLFTVGWTLLDIYHKILSPQEIERIEKIEFLDEKELLEQLLEHYCIVIGSNKPLDWFNEDQYWSAKST